MFTIVLFSSLFLQSGPQDNWVMTPDERARILNVVMAIGIVLALIYVFFKVKSQRKKEKKAMERNRKRKAIKKANPANVSLNISSTHAEIVKSDGHLRFTLDLASSQFWFVTDLDTNGNISEKEWSRLTTALGRKAFRKGVKEINWINLEERIPLTVLEGNKQFRSKGISKKNAEKGMKNWWIYTPTED